ncbi:uncharacterized protein [Saccopteryx bilineata]|uniref:uncharacterized protein n=1 Tax=Saccopteryx bilineata TaxID=59482 RepID=UPI00338E2191
MDRIKNKRNRNQDDATSWCSVESGRQGKEVDPRDLRCPRDAPEAGLRLSLEKSSLWKILPPSKNTFHGVHFGLPWALPQPQVTPAWTATERSAAETSPALGEGQACLLYWSDLRTPSTPSPQGDNPQTKLGGWEQKWVWGQVCLPPGGALCIRGTGQHPPPPHIETLAEQLFALKFGLKLYQLPPTFTTSVQLEGVPEHVCLVTAASTALGSLFLFQKAWQLGIC